MQYRELEHLSKAKFKRWCGVSRSAFHEMFEVVRPRLDRQGRRGGQAKLSVEDQILVALAYWWEYRSQFHIEVSWGLHETTVGQIVRKVENLRFLRSFGEAIAGSRVCLANAKKITLSLKAL